MEALRKPYQKLLVRDSEYEAQEALKTFIADACWICNPTVNARLEARRTSRSAHVAELTSLGKSCLKLANRIESLMPISALSMTYLQKRTASGNAKNFIAQRPQGWANSLESQETRLPYLLKCFASEALEEAAVHQKAITSKRQTGGKLEKQYFAIDSLCSASKRLSTAERPAPLLRTYP